MSNDEIKTVITKGGKKSIVWTDETNKSIMEMQPKMIEKMGKDLGWTANEFTRNIMVEESILGKTEAHVQVFDMRRIGYELEHMNKTIDLNELKGGVVNVRFYDKTTMTSNPSIVSDLVLLDPPDLHALRTTSLSQGSSVRLGLPRIVFEPIISSLMQHTTSSLNEILIKDKYIWVNASWGTSDETARFTYNHNKMLLGTPSMEKMFEMLDGNMTVMTAWLSFRIVKSDTGIATVATNVKSLSMDFFLDPMVQPV